MCLNIQKAWTSKFCNQLNNHGDFAILYSVSKEGVHEIIYQDFINNHAKLLIQSAAWNHEIQGATCSSVRSGFPLVPR